MHWTLSTASYINVIFGRHIAFYIAFYLAAGVLDYCKTAKGDEILRSPPSNYTLVPSLCIYTVLHMWEGVTAFVSLAVWFLIFWQSIFSVPWVFVVQYVNIFALIEEGEPGSRYRGLSTLVGLGDLIIGIWLALAAQWQTSFVPSSASSCSDSLYTQPLNGHESIFQRFADLNGGQPEDACSDFVGNWKLAIALVVLTIIASFVEFLNGSLVGFVKLCWAIGAGLLPATRYILKKVFTRMPDLIFRLTKYLLNLFIKLALKVGLCIPRLLAPPVRYRSRHWRRSKGKQATLPTHELRIWMVGQPTEKQISFESERDGSVGNRNTVLLTQLPPLPSKPAPMVRLFSSKKNESIVLNIAYFLHYADVINLSLVSKSTHSYLFKSSSRVEGLRIASCISSKSECYSCNMQICNSCLTPQVIPVTSTSLHLSTCHPYCSSCYRLEICSQHKIHSPPRCECLPKNPDPNPNSTTKPSRIPYSNKNPKSLCRNCASLPDKGVLIREKRERSEIVHLAGQELKCRGCKMRVSRGGGGGQGVRWWVCGNCGRECVDGCHPKWVGDPKG